MNPKVDFFFEKESKWQKEVCLLRNIALDCNLNEELKWGNPCYSLDNRNIVLIHMFKEYCALLFFKGALMNDPEGILIQQTNNVQAARQIRFTSLKDISKLKSILKSYILQAVDIEESGMKVKLKKTTEFEVPEEFRMVLTKNAKIKKAFQALTPGRQRAYLLFFAAPKQAKTRETRIEKHLENILAGKGLND
jgi:uncharacterized protein YdeI (YjbR/CyaY-like superfamily)